MDPVGARASDGGSAGLTGVASLAPGGPDIVELDTRRAFRDASDWFVATTGTIAPDQWAGPGLGEWTVRDLVGHTSRAHRTVPLYLADPQPLVHDDAVSYFRAALAGPDIGALDAAIAERGRAEGERLGDDPLTSVTALANEVLALVERTPGDTPCNTAAGGMTLDGYLATRVVELTLHTLDLAVALGRADDQPPSSAARLTGAVLAGLAVEGRRAGPALRALTGRGDLPGQFTVLR